MIQPSTVLVTGSHTRGTQGFVWAKLDAVFRDENFERLVAGGADFIDTLAATWAQDRHVSYAVEFARWGLYGERAGPIRNERMFDLYKPYLVLAFNGDTGTHRMMAYARSMGCGVKEFQE